MSDALLEALQPIHWPLFALVSARVVGLMLAAPLWSLRFFPTTSRAALAMVVSLLLVPLVPEAARPAADAAPPLLALFAELLLGLAIGLAAAVFLHGLSVAAEVVSLQMGLSFGAAFGGTTDTGAPGIGQLYQQGTLAIYAALGGHVVLLAGLALSLRSLPPGSGLALDAGGPTLLAIFGTVFDIAVRVAAPVIVALLVTNLALALLNRAVPQLHTLMVAVPLTVAIGLVVIGVSLPLTATLIGRWVGGLDGLLADLVVQFTPVPAGGR